MKTVKINGVTLTEQQIKDAMAQLEEKEWPEKGDKCILVRDSGEVEESNWIGDALDIARKKHSNIYKTEEEAEKARLRMECSARRWEFTPNEGDSYCKPSWKDAPVNPFSDWWDGTLDEVVAWQAGLIFPDTEQGRKDCIAHWKKYKHAFELPN